MGERMTDCSSTSTHLMTVRRGPENRRRVAVTETGRSIRPVFPHASTEIGNLAVGKLAARHAPGSPRRLCTPFPHYEATPRSHRIILFVR